MTNLSSLLAEFAVEDGEFTVMPRDGKWVAIVKLYEGGCFGGGSDTSAVATTPAEALGAALEAALGADSGCVGSTKEGVCGEPIEHPEKGLLCDACRNNLHMTPR